MTPTYCRPRGSHTRRIQPRPISSGLIKEARWNCSSAKVMTGPFSTSPSYLFINRSPAGGMCKEKPKSGSQPPVIASKPSTSSQMALPLRQYVAVPERLSLSRSFTRHRCILSPSRALSTSSFEFVQRLTLLEQRAARSREAMCENETNKQKKGRRCVCSLNQIITPIGRLKSGGSDRCVLPCLYFLELYSFSLSPLLLFFFFFWFS